MVDFWPASIYFKFWCYPTVRMLSFIWKKKSSDCLISFYPNFFKKLNGKIIIIIYGLSCQFHDTDRERLAAFTLREGADQLTLLSFLVTAGRSPLFLFLCFFWEPGSSILLTTFPIFFIMQFFFFWEDLWCNLS